MRYLTTLILLSILLLSGYRSVSNAEEFSMYRYPIWNYASNEGGIFETDESMLEARKINLIIEGDRLIVDKAISIYLSYDDSLETVEFHRTDDNIFVYQSDYTNIQLRIDNDLIRGAEYFQREAEYRLFTFVLAPSDLADPRPDYGFHCGIGSRSRLQIGQIATPTDTNNTLSLQDRPHSLNPILTTIDSVRVIAGPLCMFDVAWWQVSLIDDPLSIAWTAEMNAEGDYFLEPLETEDEDLDIWTCNGLSSRLSVGAYVPNYFPIRETTDINSNQSFVRGNYTISSFPIVEGPECVEGVIWWYVRAESDEGWIAENFDEYYVLYPDRIPSLSQNILDISVEN